MANIIIIAILLVITGAAVIYIVKAGKKGVKCIGCPASGNCPSKKAGGAVADCGCQADTSGKK